MDAVIERLRASKNHQVDDQRVTGHKAGYTWAMDRAEFDELERVNSLYLAFPPGVPMPNGWWYAASVAILEFDQEDINLQVLEFCAEKFWVGVANDENPTDDFIAGFVQGAAELFQEVSDKL